MSFIKRIAGSDERIIGICSAHWVYGAKGLGWLTLTLGGALAFKHVLLNFILGSRLLAAMPAFEIIADYTVWTAAVIGGLMLFLYLLIMLSTEVALTSKRVIFKRGLIAVDVREVDIEEIKEAHVNNGWLGRFFNYGYLVLDARFVENLILPAIGDPYRFVKALNETRGHIKVDSFDDVLGDKRYQAISNDPAQEVREVIKEAGGTQQIIRPIVHLRSTKQMKPVIFNKIGLHDKIKNGFHMVAHYGNKY